MAKFNEYKNLDLINVAENIAAFWHNNDTFHKSVEIREGHPEFVFYEGPPSANGLPGIHHVMARTIKDIFCRFQTQNGKQVFRKAGWDTHGLPVELGVEKELGITKEDIGKKISVEEYNQACRNAVMRYTDIWNDLTQKIGYWVDLENPYITYEPKYMESVWWLLKQLYNKKLLYKGYTIQPYSPKAGTGLSSHELNQPGTYRDVSDTTIVAQFKVKNLSPALQSKISNTENLSILAWTTTPWTLPSNTALTVGVEIDYVLVKTFNQYTFEPINIILAKALVNKQFGNKYFETSDEGEFSSFQNNHNNDSKKKIPYEILAEFKGSDMVETTYEQLVPWFLPAENPEKAFRVIAGDFVTTEDGTGIVHTAPTFGADDARVAKEADVPPMLVKDENDNLVPLVDLQGKFIKGENVPELFAGKYIKNEYYDNGTAPEKSWDVELAILLKTENKAFKVEKYNHSYPHCWRTDKPVLYYPLDSWFVKMTEVKNRLVELNKGINWKPKATGEGRFANWLENVNDWNLSRSRYWGIPLPIWRTEDLKEEKIIGSVEELINEIEKSVAAGLMSENPFKGFEIGNMSNENYAKIDLHKNIVDEIILVSDSGKPMKRENDLIDVWFDSGAMPYAQLHYPFENKELIDQNKAYPADFIAEGVDQTRGWFYTLHAIATAVFDSVAYKNVVSNGLVLDKNGQKMSKRLGNAVDPFETLAKYVGWGGLADVFDESKEGQWKEARVFLKENLSQSEYEAARESTLTAFYTPKTVIDSVYKTLSGMGFKNGNILEPSMGIGNFIGNLPDEMNKSKFYGVELDSISGRIGKLLYPESDIQIKGLEETSFSNNFFDAVIGNVPFGEYKVNDREYNKNNFLIHDYFFAKSIDKVRNGGVIAFITSSGTMDKKDESVRRYLAARAEFLGAIRLTNDTFKGTAGTEVTSDIIFLKKRDSIRERDEDWIHLAEDENGLTYNKYFVDHPEMVLGSMKEVSGRFGNTIACLPKENTDLKELLTKASEEIYFRKY